MTGGIMDILLRSVGAQAAVSQMQMYVKAIGSATDKSNQLGRSMQAFHLLQQRAFVQASRNERDANMRHAHEMDRLKKYHQQVKGVLTNIAELRTKHANAATWAERVGHEKSIRNEQRRLANMRGLMRGSRENAADHLSAAAGFGSNARVAKLMSNITAPFAQLGKFAGPIGAVAAAFLVVAAAMIKIADAAARNKAELVGVKSSLESVNTMYRKLNLVASDVRLDNGIKDAIASMKEFIDSGLQGSAAFREFLTVARNVSLATGKDIASVSKGLTDYMQGNLTSFEQHTGVSFEKVSRMLSVMGRDVNEGAASTTERWKNMSDAMTSIFGNAGYEVEKTLAATFDKLGQNVLSGWRGLVDGMSTGGEVADAQVEHWRKVFDAIESIVKFAENMTVGLEDQVKTLKDIEGQWGAIKEHQFGIVNGLEDMLVDLREASIAGNRFEASSAKAVRNFSQAMAYAKGSEGVASPERAMRGFLQSAEGLAGSMQELKGMHQQLTGFNEFGVFTGRRAVGREAYVIRQTQAALQKNVGEQLVGQGQLLGGDRGAEMVKLGGIVKQGGDIKSVQDAIKRAAEIQVELAREQASKLEKRAAAQEDALVRRIPLLLEKLLNVMGAGENFHSKFQNLSPEGQALMLRDKQFREQLGRERAGLAAVATSEAPEFIREKARRDMESIDRELGAPIPDMNLTPNQEAAIRKAAEAQMQVGGTAKSPDEPSTGVLPGTSGEKPKDALVEVMSECAGSLRSIEAKLVHGQVVDRH